MTHDLLLVILEMRLQNDCNDLFLRSYRDKDLVINASKTLLDEQAERAKTFDSTRRQ